MKHFFVKHGLVTLRVLLIAAFGFVVFTIINLQRDNHDILIHVRQQQDSADKNVQDLKDDNAQQTVILCTLILGNNVEVKAEDASKIESICKEKIQQAADPKVQAPEPTGADTTFTPQLDFTQLNQADPTPEQEMAVRPDPTPPPKQPNIVQSIIMNVTQTIRGILP